MRLLPILRPLLAVSLGLLLGLGVTLIAGENPLRVAEILVRTSMGSGYDLGMTLFYTTQLIFTGLSVAVAFQCGLFNIGAEGQLTMGALAIAAVGILLGGWLSPLAPWIAVLAGAAAGGLWGSIAGWLKAKRGSHEVIVTIMLNFIAAGLSSWVTLYLLKNPDSQSPETAPVGSSFLLSHFAFFGDSPVSAALIVALLCVVGVWFLLEKTVIGFELKAVGKNELAARVGGISPAKLRVLAMALSGVLAGLVGMGEVLGNSAKFKIGFSPGFGFMGIAVALLARGQPWGVLGAAFLFGALHKGATDLEFETETVSLEVSMIIQALVIICVAADALWEWTTRRKRGKSA